MAYTIEEAKRDEISLIQRAVELDRKGDVIVAGLLRVEAANCVHRVGMKRTHCPSLGPYSPSNPAYCVNCKKPMGEWIDGEECV